MADPTSAPDPGTSGQVAPAPADAGTTTAAPTPTDGQGATPASSATGQAAPAAPTAQEETFFDPKTLPPELQVPYKQMHAAFTKKMQGLSGDRDLLQQAKAFLADPITGMQAMAKQHGYTLTRAEAGAALANQQGGDLPQDWTPQNWGEVLQKAAHLGKQQAVDEIMRQLSPLVGNVQKMQANTIERQLDDIDPQWRTHEDAMIENMRAHPTLANDPAKLYRLSVPESVIEERATAAALARLNRSTSAARASGPSGTRASAPAPREVKSFADAVDAAREQLKAQGKI